MEKDHSETHKQQEAEIKRALGAFLLFFGVVLMIAVVFTDTAPGKWLNLICGGLLAFIGYLMIRVGRQQVPK